MGVHCSNLHHGTGELVEHLLEQSGGERFIDLDSAGVAVEVHTGGGVALFQEGSAVHATRVFDIVDQSVVCARQRVVEVRVRDRDLRRPVVVDRRVFADGPLSGVRDAVTVRLNERR